MTWRTRQSARRSRAVAFMHFSLSGTPYQHRRRRKCLTMLHRRCRLYCPRSALRGGRGPSRRVAACGMPRHCLRHGAVHGILISRWHLQYNATSCQRPSHCRRDTMRVGRRPLRRLLRVGVHAKTSRPRRRTAHHRKAWTSRRCLEISTTMTPSSTLILGGFSHLARGAVTGRARRRQCGHHEQNVHAATCVLLERASASARALYLPTTRP